MKLQDLLEIDLDKTADLEDQSKRVYHGRIWVGPEQAQKAYDTAHDAASEEVRIWDDWLNDTVYELTFSAPTKAEIMAVIDKVKAAFSRPPHSFWAYKKPGQVIKHSDWLGV
jgi:hypothetical protein